MKSNSKDCLKETINKLSNRERKHVKIVRLPEKEQWLYGDKEWSYEIRERKNTLYKRITLPLSERIILYLNQL